MPRDPHVIVNAVLMLLAAVWHMLSVGSVAFNLTAMAVELPWFGPPPASGPEQAGQLIGFAWMGFAALVGVIWAPANAYGLFKGKPWARRSTLAYWAFVGIFCCCIPGAIYGFVSLSRAEARRALGEFA